jgi:hypothetical protein
MTDRTKALTRVAWDNPGTVYTEGNTVFVRTSTCEKPDDVCHPMTSFGENTESIHASIYAYGVASTARRRSFTIGRIMKLYDVSKSTIERAFSAFTRST